MIPRNIAQKMVSKIFATVLFAAVLLMPVDEICCTIRERFRLEPARERLLNCFIRVWRAVSSGSKLLNSGFRNPRSHLESTSSLTKSPTRDARHRIQESDSELSKLHTGGCASSKRTSFPPPTPVPASHPGLQFGFHPPPSAPPLFDWRTPGTLYPRVRNQNEFGRCGACWAFSPVSALEILYSRRHNQRTHFSKQQLIDCCPDSNGCTSGSSYRALQYLVNVGVTWEESYPFRGFKGFCQSDIGIAAKAASFTRIANSEAAIVEALSHSPLITNIHFPDELDNYRSGVANPVTCLNTKRACNHNVLIVGHGEGYWIIRNTYGEGFGDEGHYLLQKGTCGVGFLVWSLALPDNAT